MIIVKIHGGLGNQLFQYAFGRCVAVKNNYQLKLDLSFFKGDPLRKYRLSHFSILENIASDQECITFKQTHFTPLERLKRKLSRSPQLVEEKNLLFDPQYFSVSDNSYLSGYWQSEKYFADIADIVKKDLTVNTPPNPANAAMFENIRSTNPVSVHIRRGDFASVDVVNQIHGTCSMDYYQSAIGLIASKYPSPCFYIFSDDIPWARENLKIAFDHAFVDINNDDTDYEDLRLMLNCSHHILANSTFSWWGAWLNPKPDKMVIAPKTWFNDAALNAQTGSIIPESWIKI